MKVIKPKGLKSLKIYAVLSFLFLCGTLTSFAQFGDFTVNPNLTPEQMVDRLVGLGVTVVDVRYTGAGIASGGFEGESNVGIDRGIILTSGLAEIAVGPNNSGSAGHGHGLPGDPDLTQISGSNTNDACVLEFDFIPESRKVVFQYVFASEEYEEWVWGGVNDSFGFFISGPGINGEFSNDSKNIALIPLTSPPVYVSIDSVNHKVHTEYYNRNNEDYIQYDGFTTVLTASSIVTPCSTYTIKLVVGDGGDDIYDSGVFLEENSFSAVGIEGIPSFESPYIDTIAVEGCNNANVRFQMEVPLSEDFDLPLDIYGDAINGIDYDTINDTVHFPAYNRYVDVGIIAWDDSINEIYETAWLKYNRSFCDVDYDSVEIQIWDPREFLMVGREDTLLQCGDSVTLYTLADGFPPFYHIWSTGDTTMWIPGDDSLGNGNELPVQVYHPTKFWVKVWDECKHDTIVDTIFVDVVGPTASVSNDTSICQNDPATLTGYGGTYYEWSTGDTTQTIVVYPTQTTEYIVWVYDDCDNSDTDTVTVYVEEPQANAGEDVTICIGDETTLTASGGESYEWSTGETGPTITVSPDVDECYIVYVTDVCDNTASDTVCVFVNDDVEAEAGPDQTICYGQSVVLTASGGIEYEWSTGETTQSITVSPTTQTTYYVTVTEGCSDTDSVTVFVDPLPTVDATAGSNVMCYGDSAYLSASGTDSYFWYAVPDDPTLSGQETSSDPVVQPLSSTWYYLTGTDNTTGCENTDSIYITVKDELLATFTSNPMSVCALDDVTIQYTGNATATASYDWNFDGGIVTLGSDQGPYYLHWTGEGDKTVTLKVYEDGCESDSVFLEISVNPTPAADFTVPEQDGCVPFTVDFENTSQSLIPETTFEWDFGNGDQSTEENLAYTYQNVGEYDVTLTVWNEGCNDSKTVTQFISVNPVPDADFFADPTLTSIENPTIQFDDRSLGDPVDWMWYLDDGTIINDDQFTYSYSDTGIYNVKLVVYNVFGCADSLFKQVIVNPHPRIYAPNAFNPNSTFGNDKFKPVGVGIEKFKMIIYNRWGEKIFETSDMTEGWDGTIDGSPAPSGTYVYYISFTNNLLQSEEMTGTVTLIK